MPEGPEVRITADGLYNVMRDDSIEDIVITSKSRYFGKDVRNLFDALYPIYINDVMSIGKKILIKGEGITIVSSLGMEGKWRLYGGKHAGIELHMSSGKILYFHDTRHFGTFDICLTNSEYDFVMKHVGPDLLRDDITYDEYYSVISRKRLRNKDIYCFLMDQSYFSGIGNYLAAEVLYDSQILPDRTLGSLNDTEIYNLYHNSLDIIKESYQNNGLTISTYFDMDDKAGTFECKCYGRKYDPDGYRILKKVFSNGRTSWYCPDKQF
jgi:DNA-formamidopyrimidine glycosylase